MILFDRVMADEHLIVVLHLQRCSAISSNSSCLYFECFVHLKQLIFWAKCPTDLWHHSALAPIFKKKLFGNSISNLEYYLEALEDYQCCNATKLTMIRQNTSGTLGPLKLRTTF